MLRTAACLHSDQARRAIDEVLHKAGALDRLVHDLPRTAIDVVHLEHLLCAIRSNWHKLHLGSSGLPVKISMIFLLGHSDAVGP